MAILVLIILSLGSLLCQLSVRVRLESEGKSQRKKELDTMEWAQNHEEEWLLGTDRIFYRDGKLYYCGFEKDNLGYTTGRFRFGVPVTYGWDRSGFHCGLIYKGQVIFGLNDFVNAQITNGTRLQYINGKRALNLGEHVVLMSFTGRDTVYYVPQDDKYYIYRRKEWKQVTFYDNNKMEFVVLRRYA